MQTETFFLKKKKKKNIRRWCYILASDGEVVLLIISRCPGVHDILIANELQPWNLGTLELGTRKVVLPRSITPSQSPGPDFSDLNNTHRILLDS
jgi:hypothetical protein